MSLDKLNVQMQNLREHVGFYKDLLYEHEHLDKYDSKETKAVFETLPIIDKMTIKSDYENFIHDSLLCDKIPDILNVSRDFNREYLYELNGTKVYAEYSSGTTGTPFVVLKSLSDRTLLSKNIWKLRNKFSQVNPLDMFLFIHTYGGNNLYPFPFEDPGQEPQTVIKELEFLKQAPYPWWHINGYCLEYYYKYITENNLSYKFNSLEVIENCGAYLSKEDKERYAKVFNAKVADNYGCREVWCIAYSCREGSLHVNTDALKVELIDEHGAVIKETGKVGKIVITSYKQQAMPFIRYRIGDSASYTDKCTCGNELPCIQLHPDRSYIAGTNEYGSVVFKNVVAWMNKCYKISDFSVINIKQMDYTSFVVNIKRNKENREALEKGFIESCKFIMPDSNFSYKFTYEDDLIFKSIFTLGFKPIEIIKK